MNYWYYIQYFVSFLSKQKADIDLRRLNGTDYAKLVSRWYNDTVTENGEMMMLRKMEMFGEKLLKTTFVLKKTPT